MVSRKPRTRSPRPPETLAEEAAEVAALLAASASSVPRIASGFFGKSRHKMIRRALLYLYVLVIGLTGAAVYLKPTYCSVTELYRNVRSGNITVPVVVTWPQLSALSQSQGADDSLEDRLYPPIVPGQKRFLLYRLIGNDMPPLQCTGQLYLNTKYTLEHETRELPECRKIWVLNHVVNATMRAYFEDLFIAHGYSLDDILVRRIDYARVTKADRGNWTNLITGGRSECLTLIAAWYKGLYIALMRQYFEDLFIAHGYALGDILVRRIDYAPITKADGGNWTNFVTAQNAARNFILAHGKRQAGARWILPFDGNQFVTDEAWDDLRRAADEHEEKGLQYFKVPMYRLYHEQKPAWMFAGTPFVSLKDKAPFMWESQIAFRNDSTELYNEGLIYAKDNKLELIDRVCGTAKFDPKKGPPKGDSPTPEDRRRCGCHREVGNDRKVRPFSPEVAQKCGYTVRLWYYPCKGVRTSILFTNPKYRKKLRGEGHAALQKDIEAEVEHWEAERDKAEKVRKEIGAAEALAAQKAAESVAKKGKRKKDKKRKGKKNKQAADEEE